MGRPDFGQSTAYPTPPVPHSLHDDDANLCEVIPHKIYPVKLKQREGIFSSILFFLNALLAVILYCT